MLPPAPESDPDCPMEQALDGAACTRDGMICRATVFLSPANPCAQGWYTETAACCGGGWFIEGAPGAPSSSGACPALAEDQDARCPSDLPSGNEACPADHLACVYVGGSRSIQRVCCGGTWQTDLFCPDPMSCRCPS
jgi:hypothetical protein